MRRGACGDWESLRRERGASAASLGLQRRVGDMQSQRLRPLLQANKQPVDPQTSSFADTCPLRRWTCRGLGGFLKVATGSSRMSGAAGGNYCTTMVPTMRG